MKKTGIILIIALVFLSLTAAGLIIYYSIPADTPPDESTESSEPLYDGMFLTAPVSLNPTLPFDIQAYISEEGVFFFLPADVSLSRFTFTAYNSNGEAVSDYRADFTEKKSLNFDILDRRIKVTVMQTDKPSMNITVDSEHGTINDVIGDKYKRNVCYGDTVIYVPRAYASANFTSDEYKTTDKDDSTPGSVRISPRGHSSWMYMEKKSFSLKTEAGFAPLGMESDKNWVLTSCHYDRSLVRNSVILNLYKEFAYGYSVDYREVELYVDGEYFGMYLLSEKIEIDSDRIDITDLEEQNELLTGNNYPGKYKTMTLDCGATVKYYPDVKSPADITGGYLLEVEIDNRAKLSSSYIATSRGTYYNIKSPEYVSYEEAVYITEYVQGFEDAVYSPTGCDKNGKPFYEYADLQSMALRYIIDEICRNVDSGTSSTFFYKDSDTVDGTMYSGPLWDYDLAFGNYSKYSSTDGFEAMTRYYYQRLMTYNEFSNEVIRQYERVMPAFEELADSGIDSYYSYIKASADMNFTRYSYIFGIKHGIVSPEKAGENQMSALDYVRDYLSARIKWIKKNLYEEYK